MKRTKDIADMLSSVKTELPPSSVPNQPDETNIAARASEYYESKGRVDGDDLGDWLQAERDLSSSVGTKNDKKSFARHLRGHPRRTSAML